MKTFSITVFCLFFFHINAQVLDPKEVFGIKGMSEINQEISLETLKEKPVIIHFWSSSKKNKKNSITKGLIRFYEKQKRRTAPNSKQWIEVVSISMDKFTKPKNNNKAIKLWKKIVAKNNFPWTSNISDLSLKNFPKSFDTKSLKKLPFLILITNKQELKEFVKIKEIKKYQSSL